jgi:hypothetical protein
MAVAPASKPSLTDQIKEAIVDKIKGAKDLKKKLDYLMNPEMLATSSRLTEMQVQAVNEMVWLGDHYDSMKPLKEFAEGFAKWRVSLDGKGREDAINMMVTTERNSLLMGLAPVPGSPGDGKGKEKRGKEE